MASGPGPSTTAVSRCGDERDGLVPARLAEGAAALGPAADERRRQARRRVEERAVVAQRALLAQPASRDRVVWITPHRVDRARAAHDQRAAGVVAVTGARRADQLVGGGHTRTVSRPGPLRLLIAPALGARAAGRRRRPRGPSGPSGSPPPPELQHLLAVTPALAEQAVRLAVRSVPVDLDADVRVEMRMGVPLGGQQVQPPAAELVAVPHKRAVVIDRVGVTGRLPDRRRRTSGSPHHTAWRCVPARSLPRTCNPRRTDRVDGAAASRVAPGPAGRRTATRRTRFRRCCTPESVHPIVWRIPAESAANLHPRRKWPAGGHPPRAAEREPTDGGGAACDESWSSACWQ